MSRFFLGGLSFFFALILGAAAIGVFITDILPWLKAPDTTHVTLIIAGTQFTGWQLFVPFAALLSVAVLFAISGLWVLRTRS